MASFIITKKKKYKFHVDVCLQELLEVPFVSAVLFAKLRQDSSNFVGHSTREEVRDHTVRWGANFSFPCKMVANLSTGVLDRCILRISVRRECKGGRSFTKLGFVDLNLAEYAGSVVPAKRALLQGYDTRHRQDNSMLKFSIKVHLLSGDTIFKVPSPSLKTTEVSSEETNTDNRIIDESSSGSLAGSVASGSSGFSSLPKKRPGLLSSELVCQNNLGLDDLTNTDQLQQQYDEVTSSLPCCEPAGHSRNSSNTSQMSKASGYHSGCNSHSRQSSSGDSGHIRNGGKVKRPPILNIPSTLPEIPSPITHKPQQQQQSRLNINGFCNNNNSHSAATHPHNNNTFLATQLSNSSTLTEEEYFTPDCSITINKLESINNYQFNNNNDFDIGIIEKRIYNNNNSQQQQSPNSIKFNRSSLQDHHHTTNGGGSSHNNNSGVLRSQSDVEIPHNTAGTKQLSSSGSNGGSFSRFKDFLTPQTRRRELLLLQAATAAGGAGHQQQPLANSTPRDLSPSRSLKVRGSFFQQAAANRQNAITRSTHSLKFGVMEQLHPGLPGLRRCLSHHRKLLDSCVSSGKLATLTATTPDEVTNASTTNNTTTTLLSSSSTVSPYNNDDATDLNSSPTVHSTSSDCCYSTSTPSSTSGRPLILTTNPSAGSLVISETGSLERNPKSQAQPTSLTSYDTRSSGSSTNNTNTGRVSRKTITASNTTTTLAGGNDFEGGGGGEVVGGRVEGTRVDVDNFITELLMQTNLNPVDDSNENSGLQLFIAKDGTAALGNHEVKSAGIFKQVVVEDNR